jgi:hypothetical protein
MARRHRWVTPPEAGDRQLIRRYAQVRNRADDMSVMVTLRSPQRRRSDREIQLNRQSAEVVHGLGAAFEPLVGDAA